ncbi:hypothetical protein DFQ26_008126 [Actinomortierella ambigua]|nr:hypothetical protein DFQ26_008126 [Actinomortierella ambigua]
MAGTNTDQQRRYGSTYLELYTTLTAGDSTGIVDAATLQKLVNDKAPAILECLDAFKKPSAASRSAMTKQTKKHGGAKFTDPEVKLATRLSDLVDLDELQALDVVEQLSQEEVIDADRVEEQLINATNRYWKERSSVIALLGLLIKRTVIDHPHDPAQGFPAFRVFSSQPAHLSRLVKQWRTAATAQAPAQFSVDPLRLDLWIGQSLTEQYSLLETVIVAILASGQSASSKASAILDVMFETEFGTRQPYLGRFKQENAAAWEDVKLLCVLASLATLDLENIPTAAWASTGDRRHISQSPDQIKAINTSLETMERERELGPFLLAWSSILSTKAVLDEESNVVTKQEIHTTRSLASQFAFISMEKLAVFQYLSTALDNEMFSSSSRYSTIYKRLLFGFVENALVDYPANTIKDFDEGLMNTISKILQYQPELCDLVWKEESQLGQGVMGALQIARGRFPVSFGPLVKLLTALATGGRESSFKVLTFFGQMPSFTHICSHNSKAVEVDVELETGKTFLRAIKDIPAGTASGRPITIIPPGTIGYPVSQQNTTQIVQWAHHESGWRLLFKVLLSFEQLEEAEIQALPSSEVANYVATMELYEAMFRHSRTSNDLIAIYNKWGEPFIRTLFGVLDKSYSVQPRSLDLIASCLSCMTALCQSFSEDIWLFVQQSAFFPSVVTTNLQFTGASQVQTTGRVETILADTERVQGRYPVTLAFLALVNALAINAEHRELWDSPELRRLKVEVLHPCVAYIQNKIFATYENWQFQSIRDRFMIGHRALVLFNILINDKPLTDGSSYGGFQNGENGIKFLQNFLYNSFLYEGGRHLAGPLLSVVGSGNELATFFSKFVRVAELSDVWAMVSEALVLTKSLLRRRKIAGGKASSLEMHLVERTTGASNQSLIQVLASYSDFSCGPIAARNSIDILTLLCALSSSWEYRVAFVGYLGTTDQSRALISTLINRIGDDSQPVEYRLALWSFFTITLTTQPGLATLFLSNHRFNPITGMLDDKETEIKDSSVAVQALDILKNHKQTLLTEPPILPQVVHFLEILWKNAKDHDLLIKTLQKDDNFWANLGELVSMPEVSVEPDTMAMSDQHESPAAAQVEHVLGVNASQSAKAYALRIFGYAIHYNTYAKTQEGGSILNALPSGLQKFIQQAADAKWFIAWNDVIPKIHYRPEEHRQLKEMTRTMKQPFQYLNLAVERWDEIYDLDHLPGESYMLDLERAHFKMAWGDLEEDHLFVRRLFHVNLNWSIVQSEMQRLSAWRFFVEIATDILGLALWGGSIKGKGKGGSETSYYNFILSLLNHIAEDTEGSSVLRVARHDCCMLLLSVIEKSSLDKPSAKANAADHFPEVLTLLRKLVQSADMDVVGSILQPVEGADSYRPLFLTLLFCYRSLHDKDVIRRVDPSDMETIRHSTISLLPLVCKCLNLLVERHSRGVQDHSGDILIIMSLMEQLCHPVWNPYPSLWIPALVEGDVFRLLIQICNKCLAMPFQERPIFFEGCLNLLLALANITEVAEHLVDAGFVSMLMHNGLTPQLQRGAIRPIHEAHGDRGDWHQAWCVFLAILTRLVRAMGSTSDALLQSLIGLIQFYGSQFNAGLDSSIEGPLTTAKLEEIERVTMLFYELSKHDGRLTSLGGGDLLRAFIDRTLFILQHNVYFFTHPAYLTSVILPMARSERDKYTGQEDEVKMMATTVAGEQPSALVTKIEGKLAAIVRNVLSAMLTWTKPGVILTKTRIEWPYDRVTMAPSVNTAVYEPASIGTLFDLIQYATTSLKEWEARLEGKAGGRAGLFKDTAANDNDDDGQGNKNDGVNGQKNGGAGSGLTTKAMAGGATGDKGMDLKSFLSSITANNMTTPLSIVKGAGTTGTSMANGGKPAAAVASSSTSSTAGANAGPSTTSKIGGSSSSSSSSTSPSWSSSSGNNNKATVSNGATESAFATLSTSSGSSARMLSLLEDALVMMTTQLALYLYHPDLHSTTRRDIQGELCADLLRMLSSVESMLHRFENLPETKREQQMGAQLYAQIRGLREHMIPVLRHFAETRISHA